MESAVQSQVKQCEIFIQAQQDNMELLDACLEKNVRLVDYEKMCDDTGKK